LSSQDKELSFSEHLIDLRRALKYSAISIFIGFLASWSFAEKIFSILRKPIDQHFPQLTPEKAPNLELFLHRIAPHLKGEQFTKTMTELNSYLDLVVKTSPLYYQGPFEPFIVYLKVALLSGLFLAFPFVFYFIWRFFAPALKDNEKGYILPTVFFATVLFVGGALVGYFLVFPFIIDFALSYATEGLVPMLTMDSYFKIFSRMLLGFGAVFELPLIIILLALLRLVTAKGLIKFSRFAVIIIFVLAALITPPDIASQTLMALPLIGLYTFSIIAVFFIEKFRKKE